MTETEIKNILLIGCTGGGKSTLANVLTGTDKFKESGHAVSETKDSQSEIFEEDGIKYRVIDTIGIGDTSLTDHQVLIKIVDATYVARDGLCQILFVTSGRSTGKERFAYDFFSSLLRDVIFDKEITNYTTIVRTRFSDFEDEAKCKEDCEKLNQENPRLAELVRTCNKLIYVDNTPIPTEGRPNKMISAKEDRNASRKILLNHLYNNCRENYKPKLIERYEKGLERIKKNTKQKKIINNKNMTEIRNILLIGRTGNGKSTLGNVLVNKNGNFEEVFKESEDSTSVTRDIKVQELKVDGVDYQVIDTIGIGDTKFSPHQVLNKLADLSNILESGLSQILFVVGGRFDDVEIEAYELLKKVLLDNNAPKYTTIVRTKFNGFLNSEKSKTDKKKMIDESEKMAKIIRDCNEFIHVDNPPLNPDDEDENKVSLKKRGASRGKLLGHLKSCQDNYVPANLRSLAQRVKDFKTEKEQQEAKIRELEKRVNAAVKEIHHHHYHTETKYETRVVEKKPGGCKIS